MNVRILEAREEIGDVVCEIAEGPIWDGRFELLRWVDLNRGLVHAFDPARGQLPSWQLGQHVGFVVPLGEDRLLAGLRDGFAVVGADGRCELSLELEADRPWMRINDGKADPAGRVWAGTMGIESPGSEGTLQRLERDWSVRSELRDLTIPNGIGWSADAATMYFTDTSWGRIDAFDYDLERGALSGRRTYVELSRRDGQPDGLTVDQDGCVWVALWYGGAVHRYTPDGRLDTVVRIPALQATSCVFGGSGLRQLFVTSAAYGLTDTEREDHPRSGRVFVCDPGVAGLPTEAFAPVG
ncbi:MAG TPA: SMP-30/gluconolactonase/LRE family protein [Solirubrobacterales bacterium]|nr:SMP-30/gluconolactonase/LRE family protein [Solirubrobacterales bacterium]